MSLRASLCTTSSKKNSDKEICEILEPQAGLLSSTVPGRNCVQQRSWDSRRLQCSGSVDLKYCWVLETFQFTFCSWMQVLTCDLNATELIQSVFQTWCLRTSWIYQLCFQSGKRWMTGLANVLEVVSHAMFLPLQCPTQCKVLLILVWSFLVVSLLALQAFMMCSLPFWLCSSAFSPWRAAEARRKFYVRCFVGVAKDWLLLSGHFFRICRDVWISYRTRI